MPPTFADIPVELFLDNIFPLLQISDLHSLGSTNKDFYKLTSDDTFWHRKIKADYNFSGSDTARTTGWKFIYKRLTNPKVYVWGEEANGRLGSHIPRKSVPGGVPFPMQLRIPGVRIVSLVAGGMSFHALDANGSLYVWGALDGSSYALQSDGFSEPAKQAHRPLRLNLPAKFRSVTCGRLHTVALDSDGVIWTFTSWGRPFKLASPLLDKSSAETTPIQVECGWSFTAILTQSSDVLVYWPGAGRMKEVIEEKGREFDEIGTSTKAIVDDGPSKQVTDIPCYPWVLEGVDPVRLPSIPSRLPKLPDADLPEGVAKEDTRLIKIAGMDNIIIGLTNKGHVLMYGCLTGEDEYEQGAWEYLPHFSEVAKVKENSVFTEGDLPLEPPKTMCITHISAHFNTFVAYSTGPQSVVLIGNSPEPEIFAPQTQIGRHSLTSLRVSSLQPSIPPKLQYQSVISVVLGDYHFGALTSTGKLFTWGSFSKGALGLGDPVLHLQVGDPGGFIEQRFLDFAKYDGRFATRGISDVSVPTEVRFDWDRKGGRRERYVFGATAAGWHMGALVIDLEPGESDDEEDPVEDDQHMPGSFPPDTPQPNTPEVPQRGIPIIPIRGLGRGLPFRIGFAGRGAFRGRGMGQPPAE